MGDFDGAATYYEYSIDYFKRNELTDQEDYGRLIAEYAQTLTDLRRFDEAEDLLKNTIKSFKKKKDKYALGNLYVAMAYNYRWSGGSSQAEDWYLQSLEIFEETTGSISFDYMRVLINLGNVYVDRAELQKAEKIFVELQSNYERLGEEDLYFYTEIQIGLSGVYFGFGNYEDCLKLNTEVAEIRKELLGETSIQYAISLFQIAFTNYKLGDINECIRLCDQSMTIFENNGIYDDYYSEILKIKGLAYIEQKRYDLAEELFKQDIENKIRLLGEQHPEMAYANSLLADVKYIKGDFNQAKGLYQEALKIRESKLGKRHPYYARTTRDLARINWAEKNRNDARKYYETTFDNYFEQIDAYFPVLSENEKAVFYNTKLKTTFEEFNSFALEKAQEEPEILGKIYDFQLATKGLILYATNKVRESIFKSGDSTLINKYEQWIAGKERLSKLFSIAVEDLEAEGIDLNQLIAESNRLEKELSEASTLFSKTFVKKNITWKDVQKTLEENEAAIEIIRFRKFNPSSGGYFTNQVNYAALVVTKETTDHPELVILDNGLLLEGRYLANYRNAIKFKLDEAFSYKYFWEPISKKLDGIEKVYFSPDGVYNQISLATLRHPERPEYLVDILNIQVVTNTKDLVLAQDKEKSAGSDGHTYLFGFPNYNYGLEDDPQYAQLAEQRGTRGNTRGGRFEQLRGQGETSSGNTRSLTRSLRGSGLSRSLRGSLRNLIRGGGISMLPGTKKEVEYIASLYADMDHSYDTLLHNRALEENVKKVSNPRTLHIATHGFFIENTENIKGEDISYMENPLLRSGLILAGANKLLKPDFDTTATSTEDGILTAYEAMNLNLDQTEVVILSACETGLGEVKNGEGVYGLQRAFLVAGAKSLIMSLWSVDDDATQELMNLFYENWLTTGNKQESFLIAQRQLKEKYRKPFYWGAFVMVGG
jgi:CHAT domain-containing protein